MANIDFQRIRKIKEETGAPVMRVKQILDELAKLKDSEADKKAVEILRQEGFEKMAKREDRPTSQGLIFAYSHHSGKIVAVVELLCETDFVARNELFQKTAADIAMQIASMEPKDVDELLKQDFIKDPSKKVGDLVKEVAAKTGENVRVGRIYRMEL